MTPIKATKSASGCVVNVLGVEHKVSAGTPVSILGDLAADSGMTKFSVKYNGIVIDDAEDLPAALQAGDYVYITKDDHSA